MRIMWNTLFRFNVNNSLKRTRAVHRVFRFTRRIVRKLLDRARGKVLPFSPFYGILVSLT